MENACNCSLGCFSSVYLNSDFPRLFSERHRVENSVTPRGDSGLLFSLSISANSGIQGNGADREDALSFCHRNTNWENTLPQSEPHLQVNPAAEVTADHTRNAGRLSPDASCDETQALWVFDYRKKHKTVGVFQRSVRLLFTNLF